MPSEVIPILLTSSIIVHDTGVKLKDEAARLRHAIESIEEWLRIDPRISIVVCDGSNYDMQPVLDEKFPQATIEFLSFQNNQHLVQLHGRGYGEGEIVRHAIEHSTLIRKAGCFAKCTSKLWVKNFNDCKRWWNGNFLCHGVFKNVFLPHRPTIFKYIDTRFYIASISFYQRFFLDAHQAIRTADGHGLEECFHSILQNQGLNHVLLPVPPIIEGVGGGTASYYRNSMKRIWKERLQIALLRSDSRFDNLFADGRHITIGPAHYI